MASSDIPKLLLQLSLEEKISLLTGADIWQTQEVARLGIGSIKTTDGPSGARGRLLVDGLPAAFVPSSVCQAATWSKGDLRNLGRVLCRETKSKASQVLLAPTICCARNPLGGRNFECFGEDPFLSGSLAVEFVGGLQETGEVTATPKHFVANEQEHNRYTINARISEKALREIYLRPFEMVVKSCSPPDCFMTSYNKVNGLHADMNGGILNDILRNEWGFRGVVVSDWGGTNSTVESLVAGLDLEMPGPPEQRGNKLLKAAVEAPTPELLAAIDTAVTNILNLLKKYKLLGLSTEQARESRSQEEHSYTSDEDIKVIRKVAADGIVLLKNTQNTLPLTLQSLAGKQVAFIGPNALQGTPGGGGSASLNPQYQSYMMESFRTVAASQGVTLSVKHALGAYARKWLPLATKATWRLPELPEEGDSQAILRMDFFSSPDLSGPVKETHYRSNSYMDLTDTCPVDFQTDHVPPFSFQITSVLTPVSTGNHSFSLSSVGGSKLYVDGELVVDNGIWYGLAETFYAFGSAEKRGSKYLTAGKSYKVTIEGWTRQDKEYFETLPADTNYHFAAYPSIRIGYQEDVPTTDELLTEAVGLADESEYAVVIVGLDEEWESEGYDRQDMALPGDQNLLVDALVRRARRPERLIFVNQSGSPVELPWIEKVSTFLQAFYGGQEAGNALADVLFGLVNPSGRLPITWPRLYSDLPFSLEPKTWPGKDGSVDYKEDSQIGYRYYSHNLTKEPQWWFGQGESYTQFSTSIASVIEDKFQWVLSLVVQNIGRFDGQEVVQVYAWQKDQLEERQLVGFEKTVLIRTGQSADVRVVIQKRDMARWAEGQWKLQAGEYVFGIGAGATDATKITMSVCLEKEACWKP